MSTAAREHVGRADLTATPKMVHVCVPGFGSAPSRALCGAPITTQLPDATPVDCIVCASLLKQLDLP